MRKIAATYIFCGNRPPLKNAIVVLENDGKIADIIGNKGDFREQAGVEYYSGILVPGFVNVHCHLELSHLKGKIEEKTGIGNFIGNINRLRNEETELREKVIHTADRKMWAAGIAAVGDISNSTLTSETKHKSKIYYHTFVESFGFHPTRAEKSFDYALQVHQFFKEIGLKSSIVPHSPYSVSGPLFQKIKEIAEKENSVLSIHNQESSAEADFYINGSGAIASHLVNNLGIDISHWVPTGKSSLESVLCYFPAKNQLLLVHNTFTQKNDIEVLKERRSLANTYFVLCPNSNLYIENTLPPVLLFRNEKLQICIGTDSLASNNGLSVLDELVTLQQNFPEIELEEFLKWACLNGAKALGIEETFGSLEIGKKPGINLLTGIDLKTFRLNNNTKVKRLV